MSVRAKWRKTAAAIALTAALLLSAAAAAEGGERLGYKPPESHDSQKAILYFRYLDSAYLGQEIREVPVPYPESPEMALVQALLDGPEGEGGNLRRLFPAGTEVLSVLQEGSQLFVTFNSAVMDALPGESLDTEKGSQEARLRRELAMASLANTLTQFGDIRSIQVLVYSPASTTASMRLSNRYYLEDNDALPDPLLRDESRIITPGAAARLPFGLWKSRSWGQLSAFVYSSPGEAANGGGWLQPDTLPQLTDFKLSEGRVSPDGATAVVVLAAAFLGSDGQEATVDGIPVALRLQDGIWKISPESVRFITEAAR